MSRHEIQPAPAVKRHSDGSGAAVPVGGAGGCASANGVTQSESPPTTSPMNRALLPARMSPPSDVERTPRRHFAKPVPRRTGITSRVA